MGYSGPENANPPSGDSAILEYGYVPSLAMGIIGVITYMLVAGPQLWWFVKMLGTRSVHGLFFFAAIIEALGFGARLYNHTHPYSALGFLVGIYLVQIATVLITAALYKAVQRGVKYTPGGSRLSPMRPRSMLTLFVILDVVWVVFQIAGQYLVASAVAAGVTGNSPLFATGTSELVFLTGNVLQAITILIFLAFLLVIIRRSNRLLAVADPNVQYPLLNPLFNQILISAALFLVRLIMRIAEGAQGAYGYSSTHEVFFGVFEYVPIFLILVIWAVKPLWKFLFPFGHRHGEGAHTRDVEAAPINAVNTIPSTAASSAEAHRDVKAEAKA